MRLRRGLRSDLRTGRHPSRVLIADDMEDYRTLLKILLSDGSFEVVGEAHDGQEAIDLTCIEQPDAVILDLAMPNVDGLSAIPEIRRTSPRTKILVLSAFDESWMAEKVISAGADRYVQKDVSCRVITSQLQDMISERTAS